MQAEFICNQLHSFGYQFITGVPDSIFKPLMAKINVQPAFDHLIANNEGEATALAAGYHIATGKIGVVYMQNSGLGNCVNPLTSLLDEYIYAIPALLMISWRGQPGVKDEPQHQRMGAILPELLTLLNIPFEIIEDPDADFERALQKAASHFANNNRPYAIVLAKNTITDHAAEQPITTATSEIPTLTREKVLDALVQQTHEEDIIVTTTGKTSRELFELRAQHQQPHHQDFYTVGSMGCAASVALAIARYRPEKRVILVDGDGACLMRLEAMATIGYTQTHNLHHILIDNNAYESTGGQRTQSHCIDFTKIAAGCGYSSIEHIHTLEGFNHSLTTQRPASGPVLSVITTNTQSRKNLGRPTLTPQQNKSNLMKQLGSLI